MDTDPDQSGRIKTGFIAGDGIRVKPRLSVVKIFAGK